MTKNTKQEEFVINGEEVVAKIKQVIKEGNARRVIIEDVQGKRLMEIPLTWAAVGTVFMPVLAAIGTLSALLTKCKIIVEKKS